MRLDPIDFSPQITPAARADQFAAAAEHRRALTEKLLASPDRSFSGFVMPLIRAQQQCARLASVVYHLASMFSDDGIRAAYDRVDAIEDAYGVWAASNMELAGAYRQVLENDESLDEGGRAWLGHRLEAYEKRGLNLPAEHRERLGQVDMRLSELSTKFRRNVQDANASWSLPLSSEQVAGMPATAQAQLAAVAKRLGASSPFAADLSAPVVSAVLGSCQDRAVRQQVWEAYNSLCASDGVLGEKFDNMPLVLEILSLRDEKARISGFANFASYQLSGKMASDPATARQLLLDLRSKALPKAQAEWEELNEFSRSNQWPTPLMAWDLDFVIRQRRKQALGVDDAEVAAYFPYEKVLSGMLDMCSDLFGVRFQHETEASTWHPSARFYRVEDASGQVLGGFYIDPFARPGKRQGAWKSTAASSLDGSASLSHVCCNSAPPTPDAPALMLHREVIVLLHEFGHCLHHLLSAAPFPGVGTGNVERDAIECPSQMLENFGWDRQALRQLSGHHETGACLPEDLLDRMLASRFDMSGLALCRQLVFGLSDLAVHDGHEVNAAAIWDTCDAIRKQTHPVPLPGPDRMLVQFNHIFAGGYAAGYYGYLWAEALSADAFGAFQESVNGVLDPQVGARFREEVLATGSRRPFKESFEAFRGRALDPGFLLAGRNLLTPPTRPSSKAGMGQ